MRIWVVIQYAFALGRSKYLAVERSGGRVDVGDRGISGFGRGRFERRRVVVLSIAFVTNVRQSRAPHLRLDSQSEQWQGRSHGYSAIVLQSFIAELARDLLAWMCSSTVYARRAG